MRPLEFLLLAAAAISLAVLLVWPRNVRWAAPLVVGALAAHLVVDGARWQLSPTYLLVALVVARLILPERRMPARVLAIVGAPLLVSAAALALVFPMGAMPAPTGPYRVGSSTYYVRSEHPELFTPDPNDRRELVVQVWYPAPSSAEGPFATYVEDGNSLAPLATLLGTPGFVLQHLDKIRTHSMVAARPRPGRRLPVVLFSHGRAGYRQHNTFQMEDLASRGFVVAAIDHPYAAAAVRYPDGRVVAFDRRMLDLSFEDAMVPYLAGDAGIALDGLASLDREDPHGILTGRLDLKHVGIFGVSMGGLIASEACLREPRVGACLAIDAHLPADVAREGLAKPFMWIGRDIATMRAERWPEDYIARTRASVESAFCRRRGDGYRVLIPGVFHTDFSDLPYLVAEPLADRIGLSGPDPAAQAHTAIKAYTAAFFGKYLQGRQSPLLAAAAAGDCIRPASSQDLRPSP